MKDIQVITRAIYSEESPEERRTGSAFGGGGWALTPHRLHLMEKNWLSSLKNQVDKDFSIHLLVGPVRKPFEDLPWGSLDVHFHKVGDEKLRTWLNKHWVPSRVQARLDTDDRVSPGWIAHMRHYLATYKSKAFLIHYEPLIEGPDGLLSYHPMYHGKNRKKTSCFLSMVDRKPSRGRHPYMDVHTRMKNHVAGDVVRVGPGYTFLSVHGENKSSGRHSRENLV